MKTKNSLISMMSIIASFVVLSSNVFSNETFKVRKNELIKTIDHSVDYLVQSQNETSGEWDNYIYLNNFSLGSRKKGSQHLDKNSFVTSSIYELLADLYDSNPEKYDFVIPVMNKANHSLIRYESKGTFNFWPIQNGEIKGAAHLETLIVNSLELNFTSIVNDSDDTALAFRALKKQENYHLQDTRFESPFLKPRNIETYFDQYLDIDRNKAHYYNKKLGDEKNSGAYLTWFGNEEVKGGRALVSWLPLENDPAIPFNVNDVDCVANANVLNTLALDGSLHKSLGSIASCNYINEAIKKGQSKSCGSYYPSEFTLHYTAIKAFKNGVDCLKPSIEILESELFSDQRSDGSFISPWHDNDTIQPTAYALGSLVNLRMKTNDVLKLQRLDYAINKTVHYLMGQKKIDKRGNIFWKGGAFFSGGSIIRKKFIWISDAYTTALIASVLSTYLNNNESAD